MFKKRGVFLIAALLIAALLLVGCSSSQPAPGTSEGGQVEKKVGEGQGFKGTIKVEVTLTDGKITDIVVLEHDETAGISDPAFEQIPQKIIEKQSAEVDAVSGATMTSKGIMEAVADALSK